MKNSSSEKSVKKSVAFTPELIAKGQDVANSMFGGNFSKYIQSLLEADLQGGGYGTFPTAQDPDCIVKLARIFIPTWVDTVLERTEGTHQPKVLEIILKLYASEELGLRDVWLREQYPAKDVAMAAEEVAKYGAKKKDPPKTE